MKIAMLIGALSKGGAERVLVNLADYLVTEGHSVTMVTTYQKEVEYSLNPKVKRIISDITQEETTNNRLENFHRRFRKLRNIWKTEKPDIVLSFIGKNNMMNILTTAFLPTAAVVAVRGEPNEEYYNKGLRIMAKTLFAFSDGVVLQTKASAEFFGKRIRRKVSILRNPINPAFFKPRYEGERENTIVAVGRLDANKNQELLIRAFAELAKTNIDYSLVIYGEGENRKKLEQLIVQLDMEDRILLPGNVENVVEAIYKTRVFVLPSNTEGMPNTLIEAMILGLTVIATDCPCGGPAELIEHGVNGLLTPVGDIDKMRENLQFVINNLQKANSMGQEATKIGVIYSPEQVYLDWEKYLISKGKTH